MSTSLPTYIVCRVLILKVLLVFYKFLAYFVELKEKIVDYQQNFVI